MAQYSLLGISGALRSGSTNTMLVKEAARVFEPASFTLADLRLPLYDGDLEASGGIPASVQTLADQIAAADAVVISGPEYNKGISGVLKNALDWVSRTEGAPWVGKPVAVLSAAAGRAGGERTQVMLRNCLVAFQPRLLQGPEVMIAGSGSAFDDSGQLTNERSVEGLRKLMSALRDEVARSQA
ncbi:NADPH-dependent FMN reductase [Primorskyibacter sp. S187A]|uniref:NADPH-dependent FMN reductase n=1 Tax=Primorskyibacter sp. S187A TaxID=3415130 RepID=UPI003C7D5B79